nr:hypothetical protein BHI3_07210 [Bacteriovorax sp. HI3]
MMNMKKVSFLVLLLSTVAVTGCGQKTTGKSVTNNYITNPSTDNGSGTSTGTGSSGTTYTFSTALPDLTIQGPGTNSLYWSSANNLPSYIDPNSFQADARFAVRIKAFRVTGGTALANPSHAAKACSTFTTNNFSKMQVKLMLRKSGSSLGETQTLVADASTSAYSSVAEFTVPSGSSSPFILEVVEVLTDHRCKASSGKLYCPYADIPYNSGGPTECVGLKVEYATL